jgi:hypothetical protein
MQKQCHIILYIPDYHVNIHRVCSTVKHWRRADLRRHVRQCYVQATPPVSDIQQSTLITFFIYYLTVKIE